jgi:hypothetical protein
MSIVEQTVQAPSPGRWSVARNIARATIATPLFLVGHVLRLHQVRRELLHVGRLSAPPPHVDEATRAAELVQTSADGVGPLVLRSYSVEVAGTRIPRSELIRRLASEPNAFNDHAIAGFVLDDQPTIDLGAGDRLVVELPGPWNGPVHVERSSDHEIVLATLDGHMEAGVIRFDTAAPSTAARDARVGEPFVFRIMSWARAADPGFRFLHLTVPIGREMQTAMWVAMCRNVAQAAGGRLGPISLSTEILDSADSIAPDTEREGSPT